jgi:adaptin ear-binding coat-associated protein 1/2
MRFVVHASITHKLLIIIVVYFFNNRADEWNLRKPLQECSLRIERRGDVLLIVFTFQKEGGKGSNLFALCKVDLVGAPQHGMDHYVKPVADSSRYFAVRVTDENGGREAVIGLGFREREEAADFSQCLINYYNAIARERLNASQAATPKINSKQ